MLRRARVEAGLTQRQVGDRIGVAQSDASDYERGRYHLDRRRLEGLVELLGLDIAREVRRVAGTKRRPPGGRAGVICLVDGCERPVDSLGMSMTSYSGCRQPRRSLRTAAAALVGSQYGSRRPGIVPPHPPRQVRAPGRLCSTSGARPVWRQPESTRANVEPARRRRTERGSPDRGTARSSARSSDRPTVEMPGCRQSGPITDNGSGNHPDKGQDR